MSDFCYAAVSELRKAFLEKRLTVRGLVLSFLSRIARIDQCPGGLNAVLEINPDALAIADALDEALKNGGEMPPLFGIPVLLKDNVNTADRLHTSAGSLALADNFAPYDAHVAASLRKAGAVILGKANMTEFANYMSREGMPSGYSSKGGQALNPWNRAETPSGSSSGSAVAVAAGLCTVAIGTETSGSILSPAADNGIVGIKPTLGLVGRSGIVPISSTLDTAGTMARNVKDAALMLGAIAGPDPRDAATRLSRKKDYAQGLDPAFLKGLRIGINRAPFQDEAASEEEKRAFKRLCTLLEESGAVLADHVDIKQNAAVGKIMRHEFKACMNYYLSTLDGASHIKTLGDIVAFNQAHAQAALKYGQSLLLDCENDTSGLMTEPAYIEAILERENAIAALDRLFDENDIQVLICEHFTNIAPFTGFPAMTIPIGQKKNQVPIGSYWIARRYGEETLIKTCYAAERILGFSLSPPLDD